MVSVITRINKVAHKAKVKEAFANVVVVSLHFYSLIMRTYKEMMQEKVTFRRLENS